jgi:N-formylglutamate deformylase
MQKFAQLQMEASYSMYSPEDELCLPVIFDSPHSGALFPNNFNSQVSEKALNSGWDAHVDKLWQSVVMFGGHLLCAHYSRMLIDLNRAPDDIDPALLDHPWSGCNPSKYSDRGMGLIRRYALPGLPLYAAPLTVAQVQQRITDYYQPYHKALKSKLDVLYKDFGGVWHIDCHSMKSTGNQMNIDSGASRPDIVIGDDDGRSAESEFVDLVEHTFRKQGYKVVRNTPYKGGYLVTNYADKANNRHSIQIEVNRALYMDEDTTLPNDNFDKFQRDVSQVASQIADFVKGRL